MLWSGRSSEERRRQQLHTERKHRRDRAGAHITTIMGLREGDHKLNKIPRAYRLDHQRENPKDIVTKGTAGIVSQDENPVPWMRGVELDNSLFHRSRTVVGRIDIVVR
ncbi:uncharacterized protein LOC100898752 [Galendromus occidentalis]|uniref:Uncharacterized protein LOC100898752 n=1 Tax=Galendromus occidentalis TaxID=34638 RepID=A0AAJ6QTJ0_9ACAR|nr:uncharacterized protein LOC100898752 [Galendromus occidentalis]